MAGFTLTGLFVTIALAFVTSALAAAVETTINIANQQLANMSAPSLAGPSGVSSPGSSTQQNILLDAANSITFVLTPPAEPANSTGNTCSNATSTGLKVPLFDTNEFPIRSPSTPFLKAKSGGISMPAFNLDNVHKDSPLITSSPYAQNEGLTFSKGTSLWQPQAGVESASYRSTQASPSIISESSFARNEGLRFSPGTSLWQPTSSTPTQHRASAPSLWSPANAGEWKTEHSASLSMRPMAAPLPASNLITQSPFCSNEGFRIPAGTSMWQPGSASAIKSQGSTGKPSLVTSSPYVLNETVRFPKGALLWGQTAVSTRFPWSYVLFFVATIALLGAGASWYVMR